MSWIKRDIVCKQPEKKCECWMSVQDGGSVEARRMDADVAERAVVIVTAPEISWANVFS